MNLNASNQWAVLIVNLWEQPQDVTLSFSDVAQTFVSAKKVRVINAADPSHHDVIQGGKLAFRKLPAHDSKLILIDPIAASMQSLVI